MGFPWSTLVCIIIILVQLSFLLVDVHSSVVLFNHVHPSGLETLEIVKQIVDKTKKWCRILDLPEGHGLLNCSAVVTHSVEY